jgi:hypothetical protein
MTDVKKTKKFPKVLQVLPGTKRVGSFKEGIEDVQKTMGELHLIAARKGKG